MPRRNFTPLEFKIISTTILVLSLLTLLFLISTIYLYIKKSSVKVDVIYIPKKLEFNIENSGNEKFPEFSISSTETKIKFEEFDYEKLIAHSAEVLEYGTEVSTFVLDKENALKVINIYNNYLINELTKDTYFVVILDNIELPGLIAGKSVYTIFLKTGENPEPIFQDIVNLRINRFEAYTLKYKRNNKTFYTLCLGTFPDVDKAKEFFEKLDIEKLKSIVTTYGPYVGRITP